MKMDQYDTNWCSGIEYSELHVPRATSLWNISGKLLNMQTLKGYPEVIRKGDIVIHIIFKH